MNPLDKQVKTPVVLNLPRNKTNTGVYCMKQQDLVYLSDLSPRDKPWDKRRGEADRFKALFEGTIHDCYAIRLANCSCELVFAFAVDENGTCSLKLQTAKFCRVRLCPVCQRQRARMWTAKTIKIMPKVLEAYPKSRFLMLGLTFPNCELTDLRATLFEMHKAWRKLIQRKDWKVQGWVRTTEVTRGQDDTAHPHYHCLLMVPPSYFSTNYVSQARWTELWRECLKVSYDPIVDIRSVRPKKGSEGIETDLVISALVETIKYSVKPSNVLKGNNCQKLGQKVRATDQDWLVELTTQLHKTRALATGGVLKDYLKVLENEPEDLIHADELGEVEADSESPRIDFNWSSKVSRYHMKPEPSIIQDEFVSSNYTH